MVSAKFILVRILKIINERRYIVSNVYIFLMETVSYKELVAVHSFRMLMWLQTFGWWILFTHLASRIKLEKNAIIFKSWLKSS